MVSLAVLTSGQQARLSSPLNAKTLVRIRCGIWRRTDQERWWPLLYGQPCIFGISSVASGVSACGIPVECLALMQHRTTRSDIGTPWLRLCSQRLPCSSTTLCHPDDFSQDGARRLGPCCCPPTHLLPCALSCGLPLHRSAVGGNFISVQPSAEID
jgi:hypothetical protein